MSGTCSGRGYPASWAEQGEAILGVSQSIRSGRDRRRLPKGFESFLKFLVDDVGVDLRRSQVGMAEGLLHEADVVGLPQEVGREGVTEVVRVTVECRGREQEPSPPGMGGACLRSALDSPRGRQ